LKRPEARRKAKRRKTASGPAKSGRKKAAESEGADRKVGKEEEAAVDSETATRSAPQRKKSWQRDA